MKMDLVRNLMKVGVPTCPPETPAVELARWLLEQSLDAIIVLDADDGQALGVVSRDDLVRAYASHQTAGDGSPPLAGLSAADVMNETIPQIAPDIPLATAVQLMHDQGVRTLYIMHHAGGVVYPAAYLSYQHILRQIAARTADFLRDLGVAAGRQTPLEMFQQRRAAARQKNIQGKT